MIGPVFSLQSGYLQQLLLPELIVTRGSSLLGLRLILPTSSNRREALAERVQCGLDIRFGVSQGGETSLKG